MPHIHGVQESKPRALGTHGLATVVSLLIAMMVGDLDACPRESVRVCIVSACTLLLMLCIQLWGKHS